MADFTQIFGGSNIIELDGTITRGRINPNSFSFNSKPVVLKTKADFVRQSSSDRLVIPSTKGIRKPASKPPLSNFVNKPIIRRTDPTPIVEKIKPKAVAVIDRETKQISAIEPINFKKRGEIRLVGEYESNQISFDKYTLEDIVGVVGTSFQFILRLVTFDGEFYYTSADFKEKLENDNRDDVPYKIMEALNPSTVVTVDVRAALNSIGSEYANAERQDGAFVTFNTFVSATGEIDNIKLIEYIDWVVSKPPQEYDDRIIPAETLGSWSIIGGVESDGVSVPKSSGTGKPIKDEFSATLVNVETPMTQVPIKPIPVKAEVTPTQSDKPVVKPKPKGSGLADLPIIKPGPVMLPPPNTILNPIRNNFNSIVRGASLVPELPIPLPIINDITGIDWRNSSSNRIRKPRNIL